MTSARAEIGRRAEPQLALAEAAGDISRAAHRMAERFARGGKLVVFAAASSASDAEHIVVEFLHPVIVGKQALPAVALGADVPHELEHLGDPADIAIGVCSGPDEEVRRGLEMARSLGLLTVALTGGDGLPPGAADHVITARSADPLIVKEVHVLAYHVLWELVHVLLEEPALLEPAAPEHCEGPVCITCSDQAVEVRVVALRPGDIAVVDTGAGHEEVSVALVDARLGSRLLVHAKEAIALLDHAPADEAPGPGA